MADHAEGAVHPLTPDPGPDLAQLVGSLPNKAEVTLVEGSSFCVSDLSGDIDPHRAHGVFFLDTRIISGWRLTLDDAALEPLTVLPDQPFAATFIARAPARTGLHDTTLLVTRRRLVAAGLREDITVRNHGREPAGCRLLLTVDADFADLFDVKDGKPTPHHDVRHTVVGGQLDISVASAHQQRGVRVRAAGATAVPGGLAFQIVVPPQGEWTTTVEALPSTSGQEVAASFPVDRPLGEAHPVRRMADWRAVSARVRAEDPVLQLTLRRSVLDLAALRIADPDRPGAEVVAAGAPWFMALFGRDALLTSWMALPLDPSLAVGTLQSLAAHQGRRVEPMSEEEPGRILHEVRRGVDPNRALGGSSVYYGSVDATPLFVVLLDEAVRWGLDRDLLLQLLPAADAALHWILECGDLDGDGFVEYRRKTDRGLLNQGWKDSSDCIVSRTGRLAEAPIALAEVQGYAYAAFRARAHLAAVLGEEDQCRRWVARADELRANFDAAFWLPEHGYYALALDGEKRPVDGLASNMGHCLWSGIATPERAAAVAEHLLAPPLFSGWGVRTLASTMATYNPVSYHNGSVWPHDNAVVAAGLMRYGHVKEARRIAESLVEAAGAFGGRLPELFCGFDRAEVPAPVPYPSSCSPQAWAAATPIALLRTMMDAQVCVPHGLLEVTPVLPEGWGGVVLSGLPLGEARVDVDTRLDPAVRGWDGAPHASAAPPGTSCPATSGLR